MKKVYFYQNNPCVIIREVTEEIVEVQIDHTFAEDMETRGHCQGCCIGDSDNKLSCTCDEYEWIIEEFKNDVNRLAVMVERRLLTEKPVESVTIERLRDEIDIIKSNLESTKMLHEEWRLSSKMYQERVESLKLELLALEASIKSNKAIKEDTEIGIKSLSKKYGEMLVNIDKYSITKKQISYSEYERLLERDKTLSALEDGGVDNWEWYGESISKIKSGR